MTPVGRLTNGLSEAARGGVHGLGAAGHSKRWGMPGPPGTLLPSEYPFCTQIHVSLQYSSRRCPTSPPDLLYTQTRTDCHSHPMTAFIVQKLTGMLGARSALAPSKRRTS